jgi:murein DD-endopeptidase MepM/ murein hydrolase activator NlpD
VGYRPGRRVDAGRDADRGLALPLTIVALAVVIVALGAAWVTGAGAYAIWWLTNTDPPTLALEVPPEVVRGSVVVEARIGPEGRAQPVEVAVDGRPLTAAEQVTIDTASLPDGPHQVTVVAEDHSWRRNRTIATATLTTDNTPPGLTIESQPQRVLQGHTWLLRIRTNEPASVEARLGDKTVPVEAGNGFGWAIVGFSPSADPASIPVVVEGRDPAGNQSEVTEIVQVGPEPFPMDAVEIEPTLAGLLASDIRTEEDRRLAENYQKVSQPKLWEGRFLMPVSGEIITEFGSVRSYNGGPVVGHHQGADIAAGPGRNVVAPARGRVVLVDEVRLRGKIVTLDHGLGVFTTYAHLASIDVQVGQMVERGQPIAKVGSTGLSTGPHLHWELWVGGVNVNPIEWTERDLP